VLTLTSALERTRDPSLVRTLGQVWFESSLLRGDAIELRKAREAVEPAASAPDAASATLLLAGRAALEEGDLQNAETFLQQACERFPIEPPALLLYATVAERQNHADAARRALITYEALVPSDADDLSHALRIATLSLELNDSETARAWVARGLARDPQNAQLLALGRRAAE
jgi:tetratricopeptide (TPR) repeat protein